MFTIWKTAVIITYCARPSLRPSSRPGLLFAQSLSIQSWWSLAAWLQSIPTALKAGDASDPALPSPFFNRSAHRTSYNAAFASCTPLYCSRDFQPQRRFGNTGLSQCVRPWCDLERAALANCTRRGSTRKKTSLSLSLSLSRERPYLLASVVESGHLQYGFSLKTEATVGGRKHAWES